MSTDSAKTIAVYEKLLEFYFRNKEGWDEDKISFVVCLCTNKIMGRMLNEHCWRQAKSWVVQLFICFFLLECNENI